MCEKKPEVISVPTKTDALIISDPKQKALIKSSLEALIAIKEKELSELTALRDSILGLERVDSLKQSVKKTPLFENK